MVSECNYEGISQLEMQNMKYFVIYKYSVLP
jgi:hypothetical protein